MLRETCAVSDRAYVISRGKIVISGESELVTSRLDEVRDSFLATTGGGGVAAGRLHDGD